METISMSRKERKRLEAFSRVQSGDLTLVAAGELLGLSYRQTKRSWSRYRSQGDAGLAHRLRGRASNRQSQDALKERSLALYRLQYADYGPTLAVECLAAEDDVVVTVTTLRRWLSQAGLWERRRKRQSHRRRRPRRERCGDLVQMDGSHHDWFEGRAPRCSLIAYIDDLQRALLTLAPEQREVVLLIALEDMTYADVSRALGIPIGTVMSRLSRGREKLRGLMSGEATRSGLRVVQ